MQKALAVLPEQLDSFPLFLSIDDTLIEKYGKKFEKCSTLFNHATHDGSNYLNGHCLVCLLLSIPVIKTEKQTIFPSRSVTGLMDGFANLDMICNVRTNTVMYDLPPAPNGEKRGADRPRKYGERVRPEDFLLCVPEKGSCRLFLCTKNPDEVISPLEQCRSDLLAEYTKEDTAYIPLAFYAFRWDIEVSFYEEKTFWLLGGYRIRSSRRIERLVNLLTMSYSAMKVLSYTDSAFL